MRVYLMSPLKILTVWLSGKSVLAGGILALSATSVTLAQTPLPPPPLPLPSVPSSDREYTFQAPNPASEPPSSSREPLSHPVTPQSTSSPSLYRVEVAGNNDSLLSQVRTVEPLAFVRQREGVIHAGVFQQQQQAQQRVQALAQQGMSAQIIPVYENTGRGSWVPTRPVAPR